MSTFDKLDRELAPDYNINYWSDLEILTAEQIISEFVDEDWAKLETEWRHKPVGWRVRLADTLLAAKDRRGLSILIDMLKSTDLEVAIAALATLSARVDSLTAYPAVRNHLEMLRRRVSEGDRLIVDDILSRLPQAA